MDHVYDIIKSTLNEGGVLKNWTRANIDFIQEGGNKVDPLNYHLVYLTSILSKLCEKITRKRWITFFGKEADNNRKVIWI